MLRLVRILLFILINGFNIAIVGIALNYVYIDFTESYLVGKEVLFEQLIFPISLTIHCISAPIALLIVSGLILFRIEKSRPKTHRFLGKVGLFVVLFLVVPSGFGLSYYAMGGAFGKFIFFSLSAYTAFVVVQGFTAIRVGKIKEHQHFMNELFALLVSAIVLRLLLALFLYCQWSGSAMYNTAAILSWLPSILVLKLRVK